MGKDCWHPSLIVLSKEKATIMSDKREIKSPAPSSSKPGIYTLNWCHINNIKVLLIIITTILGRNVMEFEI